MQNFVNPEQSASDEQVFLGWNNDRSRNDDETDGVMSGGDGDEVS